MKFKKKKVIPPPSPKLNIWIDGYEANVPQRLGSGQVAFELLRNIEKIDQYHQYTILLPSLPLNDLPKERDGWKYKVLKPNRLWTRIALPLALFKEKIKPDLFFTPTHYLPRFAPVKKIVTIFDLSYLKFPQMFEKADLWKLTNWSKYSIQHADHIITISDFSKEDIVKNYSVGRKDVTVAYPGYDKSYHPIKDKNQIEKVKSKYKVEGDYLIFIGTVQPRKNLLRLIEAFASIEKMKLVVVGKITGQGRQGWKFQEILDKPKELGIEDKVIFTGFVPDEDLPTLVNGATAFILPSLWEGFGIPAVDAMACGVPVIVSNVSSLPEVVGNAGIYVNPGSVEQITQAINTIKVDKKLQRQKAKEGIERASCFSWAKMAKIVIKVFEKEAKS